MEILIADDDPVSRLMLDRTLVKWGYDPIVACDGVQAWDELQKENAPRLAILDWVMPGLDGTQVCQKVRESHVTKSTYIILLTANGRKDDVVTGLEAGADDYITKPFDLAEFRARMRVGVRMIELQKSLADRVRELQDALSQIKQLQGILPICSYCKNIRDDQNYWQQVDAYIAAHSEARFSHSICPECIESIAKPQLEQLLRQKNGNGI